MPGIDRVKSEVARYAGMPNALVQYRDRSKAGQGATIRFAARQLDAPYYFMTGLPGLWDGKTPPSDYGTGAVAHAWKARCNVAAGAVYD
jgi:hypothetical protein